MTSRQQSKRRKLIIATVLLLVALFVINVYTNGSVSTALRNIVSPLWHAKGAVSDAATSDVLTSKETLQERVATLTAELTTLKNLQYENMYLKAQNAALRSLSSVGMSKSDSHNATLARVYSSVGAAVYGTMLISPEQDSTRSVIGSVVLGNGAFAIGTISSESAQLLTAHLFSASGRSVDVVIRGDTEDAEPVPTEATGLGSGNFAIEVPRDVEVNIGDVVYAAEAYQYPIAVVGSVNKDPASAFTKIIAHVPFNLTSLQYVLIE